MSDYRSPNSNLLSGSATKSIFPLHPISGPWSSVHITVVYVSDRGEKAYVVNKMASRLGMHSIYRRDGSM